MKEYVQNVLMDYCKRKREQRGERKERKIKKIQVH
jgi:hypothetical protein